MRIITEIPLTDILSAWFDRERHDGTYFLGISPDRYHMRGRDGSFPHTNDFVIRFSEKVNDDE